MSRSFFLMCLLFYPDIAVSNLVNKFGSRTDIETRVIELRRQFKTQKVNLITRRSYANALYQLGEMNKAYELHGKFLKASATPEDLLLGANTALALMRLERAEQLFNSLYGHDGFRSQATKGLILVYYHQQNFQKISKLNTDEIPSDLEPLARYLKLFEGQPYQIQWNSQNHIAQVNFVNDIYAPAALPELIVIVNGVEMLLTLDTGGDRLYLDESLAEKAQIRIITDTQSKYAYTGGKVVKEPLGVAHTVQLGNVELRNVPVTIAQWKANGPTTDGVLGTAILKQFLTTIDYKNSKIIFRPRGAQTPIQSISRSREMTSIPFFLASTHLMIAKGQLNDRTKLNFFVDSGLAATMPLVMVEETVSFLRLEKNAIPNQPYYWVSIDKHGLTGMVKGPTQALGNVFVDQDMHTKLGFLLDILISHQYLREFEDWTIDFDSMTFYFPKITS